MLSIGFFSVQCRKTTQMGLFVLWLLRISYKPEIRGCIAILFRKYGLGKLRRGYPLEFAKDGGVWNNGVSLALSIFATVYIAYENH